MTRTTLLISAATAWEIRSQDGELEKSGRSTTVTVSVVKDVTRLEGNTMDLKKIKNSCLCFPELTTNYF